MERWAVCVAHVFRVPVLDFGAMHYALRRGAQEQSTKIKPWKIQPRKSETARRSTLHALRGQRQSTKSSHGKSSHANPKPPDARRYDHYSVKGRAPKSSQGKSSHAYPTPPDARRTTHRRSRAENQNQAKENPATQIRHRSTLDAPRPTQPGAENQIKPWKIQPRISDTALRTTPYAPRTGDQGQNTKIKPWKIQPRKADTARRPTPYAARGREPNQAMENPATQSRHRPTPHALRSQGQRTKIKL